MPSGFTSAKMCMAFWFGKQREACAAAYAFKTPQSWWVVLHQHPWRNLLRNSSIRRGNAFLSSGTSSCLCLEKKQSVTFRRDSHACPSQDHRNKTNQTNSPLCNSPLWIKWRCLIWNDAGGTIVVTKPLEAGCLPSHQVSKNLHSIWLPDGAQIISCIFCNMFNHIWELASNLGEFLSSTETCFSTDS